MKRFKFQVKYNIRSVIVVLGGAGVGLGNSKYIIYYGIFHPDAIKKPRDMSRDIILDGYTV